MDKCIFDESFIMGCSKYLRSCHTQDLTSDGSRFFKCQSIGWLIEYDKLIIFHWIDHIDSSHRPFSERCFLNGLTIKEHNEFRFIDGGNAFCFRDNISPARCFCFNRRESTFYHQNNTSVEFFKWDLIFFCIESQAIHEYPWCIRQIKYI